MEHTKNYRAKILSKKGLLKTRQPQVF
jgi:hypothetical protein